MCWSQLSRKIWIHERVSSRLLVKINIAQIISNLEYMVDLYRCRGLLLAVVVKHTNLCCTWERMMFSSRCRLNCFAWQDVTADKSKGIVQAVCWMFLSVLRWEPQEPFSIYEVCKEIYRCHSVRCWHLAYPPLFSQNCAAIVCTGHILYADWFELFRVMPPYANITYYKSVQRTSLLTQLFCDCDDTWHI